MQDGGAARERTCLPRTASATPSAACPRPRPRRASRVGPRCAVAPVRDPRRCLSPPRRVLGSRAGAWPATRRRQQRAGRAPDSCDDRLGSVAPGQLNSSAGSLSVPCFRVRWEPYASCTSKMQGDLSVPQRAVPPQRPPVAADPMRRLRRSAPGPGKRCRRQAVTPSPSRRAATRV